MSESLANRPPSLDRLEFLGDAASFPRQIGELLPKCALLGNFSSGEAGLLARFLDVYRCEPGTEIAREGEGGEFMLVVLEGRVETSGREHRDGPQVVAELGPGAILGESALIDGEPHGATCVAVESSLVAVLQRENLARLIIEQPMLGAKILMELLMMLSARLRATRARLLAVLEAQPAPAREDCR